MTGSFLCYGSYLFLQGFSLKKLRHLVLDEADRLLNLDFEQEIDQILKVIPRERRTQLFSATMTSKVQKLQRACLVDPVKVEVASRYQTVETLRQQYMFIPAKHKVSAVPIISFTYCCLIDILDQVSFLKVWSCLR